MNGVQLPKPLVNTNRDAAGGLALHTLIGAMIEALGGQRNLLVNGGFEIWQRGNGPFVSLNGYTADRWYIFELGGGDTLSITKDTTNQAPGSAACMAAVYTKSGGSTAQLANKLEDFAQLQGQTVSLSMPIKTNVANAIRLTMYDGITQWASSFHPGDGAYHTLTVTGTIGATATQIYALPEWHASCTSYLDNGMMVFGATPMDYAPLTPAEEWDRCERYYEVRGGVVANEFLCQAQCFTTSQGYGVLSYKRKAVVPSVTLTAAANFEVEEANATLIACSAVSGSTISPKSCQFSFTVGSAALVAGNASAVVTVSTAGTVAIEANP